MKEVMWLGRNGLLAGSVLLQCPLFFSGLETILFDQGCPGSTHEETTLKE